MKNVIVAWCKTDYKGFEAQVPLKFIGERNNVLNYGNDVHVLFLSGYNNLSHFYKNSLKELGYHLHDVSLLFDELSARYTQLDRFGDYEKKCFLRWPLIQRYFEGEKIIHYDGDIVLNESLEKIARIVDGKTFVLQGCPAFTVISDLTWFEQYNTELDCFVRDIETYSADAWQQREGWEVTFKTRWAGSRFRKIITSDQDFLSHLMHTGKIKQSTVEEIAYAFKDYAVFQNPLVLHMYDESIPYSYTREKHVDYFTFKRMDVMNQVFKKRVLLWHMQSGFNFYTSKYILRKKYFKVIPAMRIPFHMSNTGFEEYFNKKIARITHHTSRLAVYNYVFKEHDFSGLMNGKTWWKAGIFI